VGNTPLSEGLQRKPWHAWIPCRRNTKSDSVSYEPPWPQTACRKQAPEPGGRPEPSAPAHRAEPAPPAAAPQPCTYRSTAPPWRPPLAAVSRGAAAGFFAYRWTRALWVVAALGGEAWTGRIRTCGYPSRYYMVPRGGSAAPSAPLRLLLALALGSPATTVDACVSAGQELRLQARHHGATSVLADAIPGTTGYHRRSMAKRTAPAPGIGALARQPCKPLPLSCSMSTHS
jgi:hypothetical protein